MNIKCNKYCFLVIWLSAACSTSIQANDVPTEAMTSDASDDSPARSDRFEPLDSPLATADASLPHFSFFVTSLRALQRLSGRDEGFGGDLRFGETGMNAGIRGADKICTQIAEASMPGAAAKQWRAFLSVRNNMETGQPLHAIDRVGDGPWYDRLGRLVTMTRAGLLNARPLGADPAIINDLPNEDGVPNHAPDPAMGPVDNHGTLTGSNPMGQLYSQTSTCLDWTSAMGNTALEGRPRVGLSWPRGFGPGGGMMGGGGSQWISSLDEAGCRAGYNLIEMGPPNPNIPTVGSGGGYGGFYCFALTP